MKNLKLNNIFIPSAVASKKLMIILHGRGDSFNGFTWLPETLNIPQMNYLLLNAPYDYFGGKSWYDLPPNQLDGIEYSSRLLTDVLDEVFENDFDISQSFLFGFSQGSLLTFEFGARYEKVFRGYLAISGYIYDTLKLLNDLNPKVKTSDWLCTHGTYDNVLPYAYSKSQIDGLKDGGFDIDFRSYEKEHTINNQELEMIGNWIKDRI